MSEGYKRKKLKKRFREHVVPGEAERNAAHEHAYWTPEPDDEYLEGGMTDPEGPMSMDPDWQDFGKVDQPLLPGDGEEEGSPHAGWQDVEGLAEEALEEGKDHPGQTCDEAHEGKEHSLWEGEKLEEDEERDGWILQLDAAEETNESWRKGKKDQLMFESLMKKWCK